MKIPIQLLCMIMILLAQAVAVEDLPVKVPDLPESKAFIRNPFSFAALTRITESSADGLSTWR